MRANDIFYEVTKLINSWLKENVLKNLLIQVMDGRKCFFPKSDSASHLKAFQSKAKKLIEAHDKGYILSLDPHKESRAAHSYYNLVVVDKITEEGIRFISE